MQPYGSWWLLRRSRQRYERTGKFTYNFFRGISTRLEQVAAFLTLLSDNGVPLKELDQPTLDRWLAEPHNDRKAGADFLNWASRHRLAQRLTVTYPLQTEPAITMTEEQRLAALARCLRDTSIPDDVRAAGALVLLYGIQLARFVEVTTEHLHAPTGTPAVPEGFSVYLNGPVILLPPTLGRILGRLPTARPPGSTLLVVSRLDRPAWIFPGRGSSGHVTYKGLSRRLRTHDLRVQPARNAALISLAADLPAPVISDLFGISVASSVKWARRAGRDWQGYIAALQQRERDARAGRLLRHPFTPDRS